MRESVWPEDAAASLGDLFSAPVDIEQWMAEQRAQGVRAALLSNGDAMLWVPEDVPEDQEAGWIAAHRPPSGWTGRLILHVYNRCPPPSGGHASWQPHQGTD